MPKRGTKPKVTQFPERSGGPGKAERDGGAKRRRRTEPLVPLKKLTKVQQGIWDRFIQPAWWLNDWDVPKAHSYAVLKAEQINHPHQMNTARVREIRMLETELCLDSQEQKRQGIDRGEDVDPTEQFFD